MCVRDGMLYSFTSNSLHIQFISQQGEGGGGLKAKEIRVEIDVSVTRESREKMGRSGGLSKKERKKKKTEELDGAPTFKNVNGRFIIARISVSEAGGATPEYVKSRAEACLLFRIRDGRGE